MNPQGLTNSPIQEGVNTLAEFIHQFIHGGDLSTGSYLPAPPY